ncbi:histone-lysine N-methyltransferase SETMAR [Elysia marginata]|uniref:Histone-lysine N-methyltransferase SETMAR n=1 Tax=Elysia marginata TaxID=1093978 RepID=A0AAV4GH19_9GAST|nr:histone-lysine N-methyltransferase SETMAR [Elysia marginata]
MATPIKGWSKLEKCNSSEKTWTLEKRVVLQHDDATPHSANLTQQWLQRYGMEILPHPAHSPDLAPSDFHLFGPLKRHLGGMDFMTEGDLVGELKNWILGEWTKTRTTRCCCSGLKWEKNKEGGTGNCFGLAIAAGVVLK